MAKDDKKDKDRKKIEQKIKTKLKDVVDWRVKNAKKFYAISKDEDESSEEREKAYLESQEYYETAKKHLKDCIDLVEEFKIDDEKIIESINNYADQLYKIG